MRCSRPARQSLIVVTTVATGEKYLKFRCTGCGNCCKEPLLPLTDADIRRIARHTGEATDKIVRWVDSDGIDMDDEPEAFVSLRQGRRVMVLRHEGGGCLYLGPDDRCTIYNHRPLGCRIFPFDPTFHASGTLRRLKLIQATDCLYELDSDNDVGKMQVLHEKHLSATSAYQSKVARWNLLQKDRERQGKAAQTAREFFGFLGL